MRCSLLILALLLFALPAFGQDAPDPQNPEGDNMATPTTWTVRLDRPSDDVTIGSVQDSVDIYFVNMTPGWHVTTGPAAIFHHPGLASTVPHKVEAAIHLFDPGDRREAYGVFFGGSNLDGDDIAYDYFLLRNTGEYLIKRREGAEMVTIVDWTAHDAIEVFGPDTESTATNTLSVNLSGTAVDFSVNGTVVASVPTADLKTTGLAGLRINHALNVHVSHVSVTPSTE